MLATENADRGLSNGGHSRESEKLERGAHGAAVEILDPRDE